MQPTLVLLPGMDGTGRLFGRFVAELQGRYPSLVISYPPDKELDCPALLALVHAAIPADRPYVLLAESFSGPIAIQHAAAAPVNLQALILVASFAANPLPRLLRWLGVLAPLFSGRMPESLLRRYLLGAGAPPELVQELKAAIGSVQPRVLTHRLRQILTVDVREQLENITVPLLYVAGKQDRLLAGRGLAQCVGRVKQLIPVSLDGPHLLLQRCPVEMANAVVDFLPVEPSNEFRLDLFD